MPLIPLSNFSVLKKEACKQVVSLDGHLFCGNKSRDFTFHFGTNLSHQLPALGPSSCALCSAV